MADDEITHDEDPNNPLNKMFPSKDGNPNYDRLKSEHEERIGSAAEQGVMEDPTFAGMGDRMQRVRKNVPQAATPQPQPTPPTDVPPLAPPQEPAPGTGLEVDPTQGRPAYTPVEPRLPEGAVAAPPAPPQPPFRPPVAAGGDDAPRKINPVLAKLRQDFGIDTIPTVDVTLGESTFTLRVLDTGSVGMAMRFSENLSLSQGEGALNLQLACVAFAVQARGLRSPPRWLGRLRRPAPWAPRTRRQRPLEA